MQRWFSIRSLSAMLVAALVSGAMDARARPQAQGLEGSSKGPTPARGLPSSSQGPTGLGLAVQDPKAMALETDLLERINQLRGQKKLEPLRMDGRLRTFVRKEAEMAARGDPAAAKVHERIKSGGYCPYGYWLQSNFGADAAAVLKGLRKDPGTAKALVGDFTLAGIGAFFVPEDPPYYQVTMVLAVEADPMAGQPGLSKAETDPVMQQAMVRIKGCYDQGLQRNPNLGGRALLKIVIGGGGKVQEAAMLQGLSDDLFNQCAVNIARTLVFPKPYKDKAVTLNHPMAFTPPQGNKIVGRLSKSQIESAFTQARFGFQSCYENRLKAKPNLAGTIVVAMTVDASGAASDMRITSDEPNDIDLSRCILKRAESLRFPAPEFGGDVQVSYPLRFEVPQKSQSKKNAKK